MNDDGRIPFAIGHLNDSVDLKGIKFGAVGYLKTKKINK